VIDFRHTTLCKFVSIDWLTNGLNSVLLDFVNTNGPISKHCSDRIVGAELIFTFSETVDTVHINETFSSCIHYL